MEMQETQVWSLAQVDPPEKEMATHSSVLAWRIPGLGEPCGLPSMGSHRVIHDWSDLAVAVAVCSLNWLLFLFVHIVFKISDLSSVLRGKGFCTQLAGEGVAWAGGSIVLLSAHQGGSSRGQSNRPQTEAALNLDLPGNSDGSVCLQCRGPGFSPWVGKIPQRRRQQPLPGESQGLRWAIVHGVRVTKN